MTADSMEGSLMAHTKVELPECTSRRLSAVGSKDTRPEMVVRRLLHGLGYRFRLHRRDLPGCPDLVLPRHRLALFVHGCFWHRHEGCNLTQRPVRNAQFWEDKFRRNVERDETSRKALKRLGWRVAVIWECETRNPTKLAARLLRLLRGTQRT